MFTLRLNAAKNTHFMKKKIQIKVVCNWISLEKSPRAHMSVSPMRRVRGPKNQYVWNPTMCKNGKLDLLWDWMLPKICILWKKNFKWKAFEIEFRTKKSASVYYVYLPYKLGGTKDLPFLKCNANGKSLESLVPLLGEIDICAFAQNLIPNYFYPHLFFCKIRIFVSVEPQSKSNLPFLYIIRFQTYWSLEPPSPTRGGDKHMRSQTFLGKIRFQTTFIWIFFRCNAYFWQCWAPKWTYFPIIIYLSSIYIFYLLYMYKNPAFLCALLKKIRTTQLITFVYGSICLLHSWEGL